MKGLLILCLLCVLCFHFVYSADEGKAPTDRVKELIKQLGDDDFEARDKAQNELTQIGDKMIEKYWKADSKLRDKIKSEIEKFSKLIKEASTDKNPELNMRANRIRQSLYSLCHPKIAFDSNRDGNSDIYTMDADGKNQTRLTDSPKNDISPRWSPDGKKIAFVSERDGNSEIYVMDADGKNQTRLTNNPKSDSSPDWSPIFLPELSALFAEEEKK